MIDFSKTYCDLHPNQLISNFCSKEQCNIGLCATCICSHTEMHIQRRTAPQYQNIRSTYSKIQENIRNRITGLEQERNRINNLMDKINNKRQIVSENIAKAKVQTIQFINKFFQNKEKQLIRKIQAQQKKHGLHNENRFQSLLNIISRDINTLFQSAQDMNSQNFLQSYQRVKTQVLQNSLQTQKQIAFQLQKNQKFNTEISINSNYISQIKDILERSISLFTSDCLITPHIITPIETRDTQVSRMVLVNKKSNQNSSLVIQRRPQSSPKVSFFPQNVEPSYYISNNNQSNIAYRPNNAQSRINTSSGILIKKPNIQNYTNYNQNSLIQYRSSSNQKQIKQNSSIFRTPTAQSIMQQSYATFNPSQNVSQHKIKKGGLSVIKNDYQNKSTKNQNKQIRY